MAFPLDRGGFGENGDPALALEVVAVHGAFSGGLIFAVGARLFQELIDECRFAVVNVGDDGDIAKIHRVRFPCEVCLARGPTRPGGKTPALKHQSGEKPAFGA